MLSRGGSSFRSACEKFHAPHTDRQKKSTHLRKNTRKRPVKTESIILNELAIRLHQLLSQQPCKLNREVLRLCSCVYGSMEYVKEEEIWKDSSHPICTLCPATGSGYLNLPTAFNICVFPKFIVRLTEKKEGCLRAISLRLFLPIIDCPSSYMVTLLSAVLRVRLVQSKVL